MATTNINNTVVEPLELWASNPYSNGKIILLPDGSQLLERETVQLTKSQRDRYYTSIQGETIWGITFQAYQDSKYWWLIADTNNLEFPFELESGTSLQVPDFSTFELSQL